MSYTHDRINNDLRKNKPKIVFPIINTIIGAICIGLITWAFIVQAITLGLFIFALIIFILYPLASWFNSYFSKKMNTKRINNFQKETDMLMRYAKRYESYVAVELNSKYKVTFDVELVESVPDIPVKFNPDTCSFGTPLNTKTLLSLGVSFAGLEIDKDTNVVGTITGMLPRSIWYRKKLHAPTYSTARLVANYEGFPVTSKTVIQALKRADTCYDNKTGWLVFGERKQTILDDAYEVSKDVVVVLREKELIALWVKLEPGLAV